ncbi:hypothetical protein KXD40_005141 [Peronospora effusa]|uniref:Uncharacterized protein n=1 Tax=Peronospora effusa TaxID=542832 RepID=A0A3M6VQS7_9STRA|nr:hypothetical protein DD238_001910 [Peronospora effusa]UIZ22143.1 hypothetical protein KXD40_005141 [Peronospora effusa]
MSAPLTPKRPNSKLYTLKELRPCGGSELPLHLTVFATKKEEGHNVYTITTRACQRRTGSM